MNPSIIFDIDGTLTDTHEFDGEIFAETLCDHLDLKEIDTDWNHYPHVTDTGIVQKIYLDHKGRLPDQEELLAIESDFTSRLKKRVQQGFTIDPIRGAKEFLSILESKEVDVGIATGAWRSSAKFKLQQVGLERFVDRAVTSSEELSRQSILSRAIERLGTTVDQCWYFGDGRWDLMCTKELKVRFIAVGPKLKDLGLPYWIADYSDQREILSILKITK